MTKYICVISGVRILFVITMRLQVVRLGIARICFLKKKRILNTVLVVEDWLMFNIMTYRRSIII